MRRFRGELQRTTVPVDDAACEAAGRPGPVRLSCGGSDGERRRGELRTMPGMRLRRASVSTASARAASTVAGEAAPPWGRPGPGGSSSWSVSVPVRPCSVLFLSFFPFSSKTFFSVTYFV